MVKEQTPAVTIAQMWAVYETFVLNPQNPGQIQRIETKRAFYCGVESFFNAMIKATELLSDEEAEAWLSDRSEEVKKYCQDIIEGKLMP